MAKRTRAQIREDFKERLIQAVSSYVEDQLNGTKHYVNYYTTKFHLGTIPNDVWREIICGQHTIDECCALVRKHNRAGYIRNYDAVNIRNAEKSLDAFKKLYDSLHAEWEKYLDIDVVVATIDHSHHNSTDKQNG